MSLSHKSLQICDSVTIFRRVTYLLLYKAFKKLRTKSVLMLYPNSTDQTPLAVQCDTHCTSVRTFQMIHPLTIAHR